MKKLLLFLFLLLPLAGRAQNTPQPADNSMYNRAIAFKEAGIRYGKAGANDSSIINSLQALRLFEQLNDLKQMGRAEWALAAIYVAVRQYEKAAYHCNNGVKHATAAKDWTGLGTLLMTQSAIAANVNGKYEVKGDTYTLNKEAFRLFQLGGDTVKSADAMNNIGAYFSESEHGNYDSAIHYYRRAKDIYQRYGRTAAVGMVNDNIARLFIIQKNYNPAKDYALAAVDIAVAGNDNDMLRKSYMKLTTIYGYLNQPDSVSYYSNKYAAVVKAIFTNKLSENISEAEAKYNTAKKQQQIDLLNKENTIQQLQLAQVQLVVTNQKLELSKKALALQNRTLELANKQSQLNTKQLETAEKQQQISLLNKENTIQKLTINKRNTTIMSIVALFLAISFAGALLYNRYKLKQKALLQAEVIHQQDMATRGIIEAEERERKRIAADLHDGVGQLFSAVRLNLGGLLERIDLPDQADVVLAQKTIAMVDESCREVRTIAHQMMPNILLKTGLVSAVRDFINKVDAQALKITLQSAGLNDPLDDNTGLVLYRVIQECVNNVIKHANASRLDIQLSRDEQGISLMVEDNGKGFDAGDKGKFEGIGLKNIITRLDYLKGTADFSSAPGKGTLVAIYIPLSQEK